MAIAVTSRVGVGDTANSATYNTASFTPTANSLLVLCVSATRGSSTDPFIPTITDNGASPLTWVMILDNKIAATGTNRVRAQLFAALVGPSPGNMAININYTAGQANSGTRWSVFDVAGANTGAGLPGVFLQAVPTAAGTGFSLTATLSAAGNAANRSFLFVDHSANEAITPEGGWTQINAGAHDTPSFACAALWNSTTFDTSPSASWATTSANGSIAFEIQAAVTTTYTLSVATASYAYAANYVGLYTLVGKVNYPYTTPAVLPKKGYAVSVVTANYAYAFNGLIPRFRLKKSPTGNYHLLTAIGGDFWSGFGSQSSLGKPFCDGYRGRAGIDNIWPVSINNAPDFSGIDGALTTLSAYPGMRFGLSFAFGITGCPGTWFDEAPTNPRFIVDPADVANNTIFTDGVYNGTTHITSATAYFVTARDVGRGITGTPGSEIPGGTTIVSVVSPTEAVLSAIPTVSGSGKTFTIVARLQAQPVPWNANHLAKLLQVVLALGAKYDNNPLVSYVCITGCMQNNEWYLSKVPADDAKWTTQAIADGFANKHDAALYAAKKIIGYWMQAFPRTPLLFTSAKPFTDTEGRDARDELEVYIDAFTKNHEVGWMTAALKATLPPHSGNGRRLIHGDQAIFSSSDDTQFYKPALPKFVGNDGVGNGTTTYTSASNPFLTTMVGNTITGTGIPIGTHVVSRTNAGSVVLSAIVASGTGLSFTVQGQPDAPQPVDDYLKAADDLGDAFNEIYSTDIQATVNAGVLTSGRELLRDNVTRQAAFTLRNHPVSFNPVAFALTVPQKVVVATASYAYALKPMVPTWNVACPTGVIYLVSSGSLNNNILTDPNTDGFVLGADWADLEPTEGNYVFNASTTGDTLDQMIAKAITSNKPCRLSISTGGPGFTAGGHKPDWLITYLIGKGTSFMTFMDGGVPTTIPVFWDDWLLQKHILLVNAVAAHIASTPQLKAVLIPWANANTNDWNLGATGPNPDGIAPSGSSPQSRWLAIMANYPAYADMGAALIDLGHKLYVAYSAAFPGKILTTSIGRLEDQGFLLNPGGSTNNGRNICEAVLPAAQTLHPGRIVAQKNNMNANGVPYPVPTPPPTTSDWYDLYYLNLIYGIPSAVQMVWSAYQDAACSPNNYGASRMNAGSGSGCINSTTALRLAGEKAKAYKARWAEVYEKDLGNLDEDNADPATGLPIYDVAKHLHRTLKLGYYINFGSNENNNGGAGPITLQATGTFGYTARPVTFVIGKGLQVATRNYAFGVGAVTFNIKVSVDKADYAFSTKAVALRVDRKLTVSPTNYTYATLPPVFFPTGRGVQVVKAGYAFALQTSVGFNATRKVTVDLTNYAYALGIVDVSKLQSAIHLDPINYAFGFKTFTFRRNLSWETANYHYDVNALALVYVPFEPEPEPPPGGEGAQSGFAPSEQTYVTVQGDTWDVISLKVYGMQQGSDHHGNLLLEANPAYHDYVIFPGGILLVVPLVPAETEIPLVPWKRTTILVK